jgi:hypothetical protein
MTWVEEENLEKENSDWAPELAGHGFRVVRQFLTARPSRRRWF